MHGAFDAGVSAITVHGRTVEQRYIGPSRWEFLRDVKEAAGDHTILGSGDLFSAEDCLNMMQETGIDGVTVARGAIGNPWIFQQARAIFEGEPLPPPPSLYEQRDVMLEHFRLAEELYGPERCGIPMRKFGIKYSALHPQHVDVRSAFAKVRCLEDWQVVLNNWYADDLPGVYPDRSIHLKGNCGEG